MAIALEKETALRCEEMPTDCGGREKKNFEPVPDSKSKIGQRVRANGVWKGTSRRVTTKIWCNDTSFGESALVVVSHRDLDLVPWLLWATRPAWPFWAVWIAAMLRLSIKHKQTTVGGSRRTMEAMWLRGLRQIGRFKSRCRARTGILPWTMTRRAGGFSGFPITRQPGSRCRIAGYIPEHRVLFIVVRWCRCRCRWRGRAGWRGAKAKRDWGVSRPLLPLPPVPPKVISEALFQNWLGAQDGVDGPSSRCENRGRPLAASVMYFRTDLPRAVRTAPFHGCQLAESMRWRQTTSKRARATHRSLT